MNDYGPEWRIRNLLVELDDAEREVAARKRALAAEVAWARSAGVTWVAMAKWFGVSRQAVTERFGS